ncbi:MAG: hypothetical protein KDB53_20105, partial [Planctomycetes bacterium]|nr:hypothetical protein [Planctomycetota bacterium]
FPGLVRLRLGECRGLDAVQLAALAAATDLKELDLGWIESLDSRCFAKLASFKSLSRLVLCEDHAPDRTTLADLRRALPNCRITFE